MPHRIPPGQNLLIDADDTLWENNIYFERAIANFISFLNHHEFTPDQVREVLYDVERENIRLHGYGMDSFARALVACFEQLSVEPLTPLCTKPFAASPTPSPGIPWKSCPKFPRHWPTSLSATIFFW